MRSILSRLLLLLVASSNASSSSPPPPFSLPFDLLSTGGRLVVRPRGNNNPSLQSDLHIKGVVWMGMQADGCPHDLSSNTQLHNAATRQQEQLTSFRIEAAKYARPLSTGQQLAARHEHNVKPTAGGNELARIGGRPV